MVFASLLVCGLSTILQVRRLGPVGAGAVLPMFTAAFAIPFCITAVADGGPATLTTLVIVSALIQLAISAVHSEAYRHAHGDDDSVHHPGVRRFQSPGRRVRGRACGGAADCPYAGHRRRTGSSWIRAIASLGAAHWDRRRLHRRRPLWDLQLRPSPARTVARAPASRAGAGARLWTLVLDAVARLSVPRSHHFDSGQRRGHRDAAGVMA